MASVLDMAKQSPGYLWSEIEPFSPSMEDDKTFTALNGFVNLTRPSRENEIGIKHYDNTGEQSFMRSNNLRLLQVSKRYIAWLLRQNAAHHSPALESMPFLRR